MTVIAAALKHMLAAGMPHEAIIAAVEEMEASLSAAPTEKARSKGAIRTERWRENQRHKASQSVTVTECDDETSPRHDSPLSPAPLLSPHTPQITPHPHTPGNKPRARKGDFPKPDWADEQLWADFLTNRKTKRLSNTATAHRMFLADIDRFSDEEWPPGRLLEFAVARGWGAIFDPRNRDVSHVTARQNRNPAEPTDALVRTVARRQAERAAGRLHDDEQRAGGWA